MDLIEHILRQKAFSLKTFGPGPRTESILDHIRKELAEIADDPFGIEEWMDLVALALDGAWRAGYSPVEIAQQLRIKLFINEHREWPDWKTAEPDKAIEHIRGSSDIKPVVVCGDKNG